jgi:acyl-CoA thioester hydrolase
MTKAKDLRRDDYPYIISVPTRWNDNDMLGHVNNVVFYRYIEAVVVRFLMEEAGLDWLKDPVIPYAAEILCRFHRPLSFPDDIEAALKVDRLGARSVTYGVALFSGDQPAPAATGHFIHVFVDRQSEKSAPIPAAIGAVLERTAGRKG